MARRPLTPEERETLTEIAARFYLYLSRPTTDYDVRVAWLHTYLDAPASRRSLLRLHGVRISMRQGRVVGLGWGKAWAAATFRHPTDVIACLGDWLGVAKTEITAKATELEALWELEK